MAKQNINIGSSPNKGDGDPLRTAFTKVNSNFTELYDAIGLGDGSVNLGSLEFNGSTITTNDSSRIEIAQEVRITSDLTMRGSIVPNIDNQFDLGSPTNQWRSLYVSNNTIFLGGIPLAVDNQGNLTVNGNSVGGGSSDSVVNGLFNITLDTTGHFIPGTDNLQDLGSDTNRFRHVYVGPGSVYIGNNVITESATGGLVLPGVTRATGYYADEVDNEDRWGSNPTIIGTVTVIDASRYRIISGQAQASANYSPATYTAQKENNRIDEINVSNGGSGWDKVEADYARDNNMYATNVSGAIATFNAGNWVQIPFRVEVKAEDVEYEDIFGGGISLPSQSGQSGKFLSTDGEELSWETPSGEGGGLSVSDFGEGFTDSLDAGKITTSKLYNENPNPGLNNQYTLEVTNGGVVALPDGSIINGATLKTIAGNYAGITAGPASPAGKDEDSWVWVDNDGANIATKYSTDNHQWKFNNTGGLVFPDATVQTTAYTGQTSGDSTVVRQDTAPTAANGTLWFNTLEGRLYIKYSDVWVDAAPLVQPPPDTDIDVSSITFSDASVQTTAWPGPTTVDRLVNGVNELVLGTDGVITFPSGATFDGETLKSAPNDFDIGLTDVSGINSIRVGTGVALITTNNNEHSWRFDRDGDLTIPGNILSETAINIDINLSDSTLRRWQFGEDGDLNLPQGSTIGETATTTVITPPGALPGQSLVIRPTIPVSGITSNYPSGFADGDTIVLSVTPNSGSVTGTVDYTFTGATSEQLGRALTGTLTFNNEGTKDLTWTVPVSSSITTFTFTLSNASGFSISALAPYTLTRTGSSETSHIHLVAGDPVTTDLYLGDDDQYVKVEKDGGDVVIGTDANTKHWRFDGNGILTLPPLSPIIRDEGGVSFINFNGGNGELVLGTSGLDSVVITVNDDGQGDTLKTWEFDNNGTLTLPGSGVVLDTTGTPGLTRKTYTAVTGWFDNNTIWFETNATLASTTVKTGTIQGLSTETPGYAEHLYGYFKAPTTATYTFGLHADDAAMFWIGEYAVDGQFDNANADITYVWPNTVATYSVALTKDVYYPIRLQWGNNDGTAPNFGSLNEFWYSTDGGTTPQTNFTNTIYTEPGLTTVSKGGKDWTFSTDGSLTFPDATVQRTAYQPAQQTILVDEGSASGAEIDITALTSLILIRSADGYTTVDDTHYINLPFGTAADVDIPLGTKITIINRYDGTVAINGWGFPPRYDMSINQNIDLVYINDGNPFGINIWWVTGSFTWI